MLRDTTPVADKLHASQGGIRAPLPAPVPAGEQAALKHDVHATDDSREGSWSEAFLVVFLVYMPAAVIASKLPGIWEEVTKGAAMAICFFILLRVVERKSTRHSTRVAVRALVATLAAAAISALFA